MDYIFKKKVNNKIKLVVGPLARTDIDAVMQLEPKLPVLALNDVNQHAENVWQFSLSKQHDAAALTQLLKNDRIKNYGFCVKLVLKQPQNYLCRLFR